MTAGPWMRDCWRRERLIELNSDPVVLFPDHVAGLSAVIVLNHRREPVRNGKGTFNFKTCTGI